jgi:putative ABC transport system substrate-binding protein
MSLVEATTAVCAQTRRGLRRIGILFQFPRPAPGVDSRWDALVQHLRDFGYVEGQTIVFEYAYTEGDPDRRIREATRLVALRPDVIVAGVGADAVALRQGTVTIPIVVLAAGDLVRSGLVTSLARPGGNVTGLQILQTDLVGKRLELLKDVAPGIKNVGVLHEKIWGEVIRQYYESLVGDVEAAAKRLKLGVKATSVEGAPDLDRATERLRAEGVDALYLAASPFMTEHRRRVTALATKYRLPAIYEAATFVEAGGLMSYGPSIPDLYHRGAAYVDRILKGAKPADLPVEQPTKFELVINAQTAKQLGVTVPNPLLLRADRVVE